MILDIVAIACIAYGYVKLTGPPPDSSGDEYGSDGSSDYDIGDPFFLFWDFITLGLSFIWCLANVVTRLVRRRPVHPGANVGCDLILWMALIVTGIAAIVPVLDALSWSNNNVGNGGEDTRYILLANGTEVLQYGQYGYFPNGTYGFIPESNPGSSCPGFASCDVQNAYLAATHHIGTVLAVGVALTYVAVLLHFTLFVWACVDTHRRNADKVDRRATVIAQTMIAEMAERGIIPSGINHPGPLSSTQEVAVAPLLNSDSTPARPSLAGRGGSSEVVRSSLRPRDSFTAQSVRSAQSATPHRDSAAFGRNDSNSTDRSSLSINNAPPIRERHPDHRAPGRRLSKRVSREYEDREQIQLNLTGNGYGRVQQQDAPPSPLQQPPRRMRQSLPSQAELEENPTTGRAM
ncbi:hypothetical protein MMC25_007221 [Agyrium rufum]|nr:hypothetical protein [Agyrium rufum]